MNNVKLLNIKCLFFQFFHSQVALKNFKKMLAPKKKLKWRPWWWEEKGGRRREGMQKTNLVARNALHKK